MALMAAMSARMKNSTAPRLAAGRYPSLSLSISTDVICASFSFSNT